VIGNNSWELGMSKKVLLPLILIGGGLVILAGAAIWLVFNVAMKPASPKINPLADLAVGDPVDVVGEVVSLDGQVITFEVLAGQDYDQRTGTLLKAVRTGEERFAMGNEADLKVGAITQLDGYKVNDDTFHLQRIVILTGYVKGPPSK
jgi:hypothetical protein